MPTQISHTNRKRNDNILKSKSAPRFVYRIFWIDAIKSEMKELETLQTLNHNLRWEIFLKQDKSTVARTSCKQSTK